MIKSVEEIQCMSVVGVFIVKVFEVFDEVVWLGISMVEIDCFCECYIVDIFVVIFGSKGQYGYLFMVNILVNEVVCYGWLLVQQIFCDGDIVNVDVMVIKDGYFGDSSKMYWVGVIDCQVQKLFDVICECLYWVICVVCLDVIFGDIGYVIQSYVEVNGYLVVCEYCGYGIGCKMYEVLQVLYFGCVGVGVWLKVGMIFIIELMINQGGYVVKLYKDGWIVIICDCCLLVQYEYIVLVIEWGCWVLILCEEECEVLVDLVG